MLRRPLGSTLFPYTTLFRSFVLEAGKRVAGSCVAKQDLSMVTYKLVLADGARAQMGAMKLGDRWYLSYFTGLPAGPRSEERRVGKECRSRWAPYHEKEDVDM